jgi:HlyD family type I secretion membrane fusion protein
MKLDFLHLGGPGGEGSGGGRARAFLPRRFIERRMRQLDIRPLDHADGTIGWGMIAAGGFLAVFLLFAFLAPISGAAIAPAVVQVAGDTFNVQPAASGIVTEVMVREGQAVRAGQPLVRLNGVRSGASLRQAQARVDALRALEARLVAERDGAATLTFPPALAQRGFDPVAQRAMATQQAIFAKRGLILGADRGTADEALVAATARRAATSKQLSLIRDQLADYRSLYRRGFARLTTIRDLERQEAGLVAELAAGGASQNQAEIARNRVRDAQAMEIAAQLGQVQEQLAQVTPQLDVSRYFADQDQLRAPAAGRVSGVVSMGPGMVVSGGRTLMQIVPSGRPLIVEARVKPSDIDDVRLGQEATVRFSTVNPNGKTAFKGRVVTLSPAQITEGGQAFFKAQIVLDDPAEARREGLTLQPGVPASVNIKTKDRTLFDYLFTPFSAAISRSFREE